MRRIAGPVTIFIVVLLLGIFVYWMIADRHDDVTPTLERLIEAGHTIEEILQHPDVARINHKNPRLFPNLDNWTEDDLQFARAQIETRAPASAALNIHNEALRRQNAQLKKRIAVKKVIIAALEAHGKGPEPFTIENSLPAAVRTKVEEAFGEDAETVLTQIEEAFATYDSSTRVFESDGGIDGYVEQMLESLSAAPADK